MLKNNKIKLIKYYNLINHNLIYNNKAINRYKKDNYEIPEDKFFLNKQGKYNRRHTRDNVATADSKRLSNGSQKRNG